MKTKDLFLRVALLCFAFFPTLPPLQAQPCSNPVNLISNGSFASGFTGYSSSLSAFTTTSCQVDRYGIGTAFDDYCSSFPSTPNGTDMMIVDLHTSPTNTMILQQSISGVTAGTNYTIGFQGACRLGSHPVPLTVSYAGYSVGTITINSPAAFNNYSLNWTAPSGVPSSGNFTVRIGGSDIYYDFALTDVQFSYCNNVSWRNTYQNDKDHNHFSVVELQDEDFAVAGTLYDRGKLTNTTIGVRRFNSSGTVLWQQEYNLNKAYDTRCFDVAVAGSADEPILALTGYVQSSESTTPKPFVMTLRAADGSIINYQEYTMGAYPEATALDLFYSATEKSFFIAGYEAEKILDESADKIGFVLSIDPDLNVNWVRYITSPASASSRNMANNLTEIDGRGIFVTGSVDNDPIGGGNVSTLKLMLDYAGNTVWDLSSISSNSFECGVDAVYNRKEDALYVLSNNALFHSFEIQRIDNASGGGASIGAFGSNSLPDVVGDVEGFSMAFDPNSEDLIVAGMIRNMPGASVNTPTFISHVDRSSFGISSLYYIKSNNTGYRSHDHDVFQAFYGQQALINYPDILGVFPSNFVILGYEGLGGYSLSVTRTNANGQTPSSKDCEVAVEAGAVRTKPTRVEIIVREESAEPKELEANFEELVYKIYKDCEPLEIAAKKYSTGISETITTNDLKVYPNPTSDILKVALPQSGNTDKVELRLVDAFGRVVITNNHATMGTVIQLDVANLPEGVYFLSVRTGSLEMKKSVTIIH